MTSDFREGHRVRHIRDGIFGTIAAIEQARGPTSPDLTYQIKWDNGSVECRVTAIDIAAASATYA